METFTGRGRILDPETTVLALKKGVLMTRYLKQRDKRSCGPVAIINALKWAGIKEWRGIRPVNKELKAWQRISNCSLGTNEQDLHKVLCKIDGLKIHNIYAGRIKLKYIDEWLDNGGSIILLFFHRDFGYLGGHYINIVGRTKKHYYVTNYSRNRKSLSRVSRKSLATDLSFCVLGKYAPLTWLISKA